MGKKDKVEQEKPERPVITDKNVRNLIKILYLLLNKLKVLFYNAIRTNNPAAAQKLIKEHKIDVNYTLVYFPNNLSI